MTPKQKQDYERSMIIYREELAAVIRLIEYTKRNPYK